MKRNKINYIYSNIYDDKDIADSILTSTLDDTTDLEQAKTYNADFSNLDAYIRKLFSYRILTRTGEYKLFTKMNCAKHFAHKSVNDPTVDVNRYLKIAEETRNVIVTHNLRLVISVARKLRARFDSEQLQLEDIVSDLHESLFLAVDKFDVMRKYKFSTYCTTAMIRNFHHSRRRLTTKKATLVVYDGDEILKYQPIKVDDQVKQHYLVSVINEAINELDDEREKDIIRSRYGWDRDYKTLDELGHIYSITKERVRQIQRAGLRRLRVVLTQRGIRCDTV